MRSSKPHSRSTSSRINKDCYLWRTLMNKKNRLCIPTSSILIAAYEIYWQVVRRYSRELLFTVRFFLENLIKQNEPESTHVIGVPSTHVIGVPRTLIHKPFFTKPSMTVLKSETFEYSVSSCMNYIAWVFFLTRIKHAFKFRALFCVSDHVYGYQTLFNLRLNLSWRDSGTWLEKNLNV